MKKCIKYDMTYYLPLIMTVVANIIYHIAQKYTSHKINPVFSLFVTYLVATVLTAVLLLFYRHENSLKQNIQEINWSTFLLGLALVVLELGYLLVYRVGWNISTASIISNILLTIVLIPIGMLLFKERISLINVLGIGVSIVGILLINYSE